MNIIQRNFFRLLRAGAFGSEGEQIEPMSAWKWRQLFLAATRLQVASLLHDGQQATAGQFFMRLTDETASQWLHHTRQAEQEYASKESEVAALLTQLAEKQFRPILCGSWTSACLYPTPSHHSICRVDIFFPYATQGRKADEWAAANAVTTEKPGRHVMRYQWMGLEVEHRHRLALLSNKLNNTTLQNIVEQEWLEGGTSHIHLCGKRIETIAPTLALLMALLDIFKTTLHSGISLPQVVDLGMQLRKQGDQVDFVKLQTWIEHLHFARMAQLTGELLTQLLGFTPDEVPFMDEGSTTGSVGGIVDSLFQTTGQSGTRFYRYSPGESFSEFIASVTRSLGNIEE